MKELKKLMVYSPGKGFPPVSVTGGRCDLMCDHCRGKHLLHMADVSSKGALEAKAASVKDAGGTGMLISGGCDQRGVVPITQKDEIRTAVDMGLEINVHSGLISKREADELVNSGVSMFSLDVHQDPSILSNVLHLDCDPERYGETIDAILSAGGKVSPHITVGFGAEDLLLSADLLKKKGLMNVTLLALVPTEGTDVSVPVPEESVIMALSLLMEMGFTVTLGCMRPREYRNLEIKSIEMGIRRIANPSQNTLKWAAENGFEIEKIGKCCCF